MQLPASWRAIPRAAGVAARAEFIQAINASADLGQWSLLGQLMHEWANTAIVHADPELARALGEPITITDGRIVPNPMDE